MKLDFEDTMRTTGQEIRGQFYDYLGTFSTFHDLREWKEILIDFYCNHLEERQRRYLSQAYEIIGKNTFIAYVMENWI